NGGEVEIFAPDERRQLSQERLTGFSIAGYRPRLDHGGALPVLAEAFVVGERRVRRQRDLSRSWVRAQTKVRPEHVSVARSFLEDAHKLACQAHEKRLRLNISTELQALPVIENEKIDIAGIIPLSGAVFSHS